jgi:hypothetical protein
MMIRLWTMLALAATLGGCASLPPGTPRPANETGTLAQVYYWKAKPGKFEEYSKYIREQAEPIDHEAQRRGAFLSVTTYVSTDSLNPWTHMRIFILRDSAQWRALGGALDSAGIRLHPDSVQRRLRGEYSASLRDRAGAAVFSLLR